MDGKDAAVPFDQHVTRVGGSLGDDGDAVMATGCQGCRAARHLAHPFGAKASLAKTTPGDSCPCAPVAIWFDLIGARPEWPVPAELCADFSAEFRQFRFPLRFGQRGQQFGG